MLVNLLKRATESISNTLARPQQDIINRRGERERRRITDYATLRRDNPVFSAPKPKTVNMPVVLKGQSTTGQDIPNLIRSTAQKYGFNPRFLDAVVNAESSYNPRAISKSGAIGLGQLTPVALRDIGYAGSPEGLYDPATNLDLASQYLSKIHDVGKKRYGRPLTPLEWYALYSFGPYNNQPISEAYRSNFTKKYNSSQF